MGCVDLARLPLVGRLSARRRTVVLLAVLVVLVVGIVAGLVAVLRDGHRSPVAEQDRPGTVVLVPGYGGSTGSLTVLADRLRSLGRPAVVVTLPGQGEGDFTEQADALGAAVTRVLDGGAPSVDLIGYSAGGVVVRLWLSQSADARSVRRVVTLGSPLHGTTLAGVGSTFVPGACPTACQELAPGSALLARLDAAPVPVPWLSVWTRDDQTVTPPDSARLAGAVNVAVQEVCPDARLQHGQLPSDPLVIGLVLRALDTGELTAPDRPTAPRCARLAERLVTAQVLMSLVTKLAQAAPSRTTTYTAWMPMPRSMSRQKMGSRKKSTQANQYRVGRNGRMATAASSSTRTSLAISTASAPSAAPSGGVGDRGQEQRDRGHAQHRDDHEARPPRPGAS